MNPRQYNSDKPPTICFVANYTKTYTFHEVAKQLEENGYTICWIVVNRKLHAFLQEHYPHDRILYLNKSFIERESAKIGELKVHELVLGDRTLRYDPDAGRRYLVNIQRPLYNFISSHDISHVFGELTWAHELLLKRITERCPELACTYLNPHTIRIPNGRFAFFTDEFQAEMLRPAGSDSVSLKKPLTLEKPDYLTLNDKLVKSARSLPARLAKIKRFITEENIDPEDPTLLNRRWLRFRIRCREELNKELYRFVNRISLDEVGDRKFVFVALHKQPEASIDVIGRYYEDQYANILNIWRILPEDWLLLIKEHTNAIGDRSLGFYRRLSRLPNVHFLHEGEDSHAIIRRCEVVVTVSGTVAYEAVLMGKKSLTLAPTFFNRFPGCRHIGLNDLKNSKDIHDVLDSIPMEPHDIEGAVMDASFEGVISDPVSNAKSIEPDNVCRVAEAIARVTNS